MGQQEPMHLQSAHFCGIPGKMREMPYLGRWPTKSNAPGIKIDRMGPGEHATTVLGALGSVVKPRNGRMRSSLFARCHLVNAKMLYLGLWRAESDQPTTEIDRMNSLGHAAMVLGQLGSIAELPGTRPRGERSQQSDAAEKLWGKPELVGVKVKHRRSRARRGG